MTKHIEPDDVLDDMLQQAQRAEAAKRVKGRTLPSIYMSNPTASITSVYGKPVSGTAINLPAIPAAEFINYLEVISIYALVAHAAHNQNMKPEKVREAVKAQFDVNRVENIRRGDYEKAIRFLVDLRLDALN